MKQILVFILLITVFQSCSKKGTLYEDYWETIEAGAYQFTEANCKIYKDQELISDSTIQVGESYILLYTSQSGGFYNELDLYGDWMPPLFTGGEGAIKVWNMENDDKRISFSYYSNYTYVSTSSLTMENTGKAKQQWHYITESLAGVYSHYTITVKRSTSAQ